MAGGTYRCYLHEIRSNIGWGTSFPVSGPADGGNVLYLNDDPAGTGPIGSQQPPVATTGTKTIHFELDETRIDLTGAVTGTIGLPTLPAGFKPTTKTIVADFAHTAPSQLFFRFDDLGGSSECEETTAFGTNAVVCSKPVMFNMLSIVHDGVGVRAVLSDISHNATIQKLSVRGDYVIQQWYFDGDIYVLADTDPGGDFEPVDYPTPVIWAIVPDNGPIAGGTAVTITGEGFLMADGSVGVERVTFDGFLATSVVVTDQHTIHCVTPSHWKGGVDVIVRTDHVP